MQSKLFEAVGGLVVNDNVLGRTEGESLNLINFETGLFGGYRRINGFAKYSSTELSGTGKVLGAQPFNSGVLAARLNTLYFGTGTTWATVATRTSGSRYEFDLYDWTGTPHVLLCDGVNQAAKYDGTTYTLITDANAPTAPAAGVAHKDHIFLASDNGNSVVFSSPFSDTDFDPALGAGELVMSDTFVGMRSWREQLIIFCKNSIHKLTGSSSGDFLLQPITRNIGCLAAGSIQELAGDIMFLAPDGIRTISGTDKIDDVEIGTLSRNIHPITDEILSSANVVSGDISSLVIREKSQYRLFYPNSSDGEALCKGIIAGLRGSRDNSVQWEWGELLGIKPYSCGSAYNGDDELIVHGGYDDGFIYQQESGNSFNGSNVSATYRTPDYDLGDLSIRKVLHRVRVFYRIEGTTSIALNVYYDYGANDVSQPSAYTLTNSGGAAVYGTTFVYGSSLYGATFEPSTRQSIEGSGFTAALNFSTNDTNAPYTIEGFSIEYVPMDRR